MTLGLRLTAGPSTPLIDHLIDREAWVSGVGGSGVLAGQVWIVICSLSCSRGGRPAMICPKWSLPLSPPSLSTSASFPSNSRGNRTDGQRRRSSAATGRCLSFLLRFPAQPLSFSSSLPFILFPPHCHSAVSFPLARSRPHSISPSPHFKRDPPSHAIPSTTIRSMVPSQRARAQERKRIRVTSCLGRAPDACI